jgi:hypothetical protein
VGLRAGTWMTCARPYTRGRVEVVAIEDWYDWSLLRVESRDSDVRGISRSQAISFEDSGVLLLVLGIVLKFLECVIYYV